MAMPAPTNPCEKTANPLRCVWYAPARQSIPDTPPVATRTPSEIQLLSKAYLRNNPTPIMRAKAPMRLSSFPPTNASHSSRVREGGEAGAGAETGTGTGTDEEETDAGDDFVGCFAFFTASTKPNQNNFAPRTKTSPHISSPQGMVRRHPPLCCYCSNSHPSTTF